MLPAVALSLLSPNAAHGLQDARSTRAVDGGERCTAPVSALCCPLRFVLRLCTLPSVCCTDRSLNVFGTYLPLRCSLCTLLTRRIYASCMLVRCATVSQSCLPGTSSLSLSHSQLPDLSAPSRSLFICSVLNPISSAPGSRSTTAATRSTCTADKYPARATFSHALSSSRFSTSL